MALFQLHGWSKFDSSSRVNAMTSNLSPGWWSISVTFLL
jgi:hypothetical protein